MNLQRSDPLGEEPGSAVIFGKSTPANPMNSKKDLKNLIKVCKTYREGI